VSIRPPLKRHLWVWLLWLAGFYVAWVWLVFGHGRWGDVTSHWPIALTMSLGSYVAGSTPMGGGTIGFPILVLLFRLPATLGRDFSFAVQAIGMTSASIFILTRRQPLAWAMLQGACLGAIVGLPIGIFAVAPLVNELWIKVVFAVVWASFGLLHLYRIDEISSHEGMTEFDERWDFKVGFAVGMAAAASVAAVTGVGIDMVLYAALVLLCRADLKIAIPTSVIVMAFTSVLGIAIKGLTTGVHPGVYENWLAAAPIVALGAPLGAFVVNVIGRRPTLVVVSLLCIVEFVWTCFDEFHALGPAGLTIAVCAVGLGLLGFERMRLWGGVLVGEQQQSRLREELAAKAAGIVAGQTVTPWAETDPTG
jgi:uncharacterized membrane protein YfcA